MSFSDTWETVRRKGGARGKDILSLAIMVFAILAMGMVGYGQFMTSQITQRQDDILPVADGVANRAAASHLYLIEALGGDASINVARTVFAPLTEAQRLLAVQLKGGTDQTGHLAAPVSDPTITKDLKILSEYVDAFKADATARWLHRTTGGKISERSDAEFNQVYTELVGLTDRLSADVKKVAAAQRDTVRRLNFAVLGILALVFGGLAYFARRSRRSIVQRNAALELGVRERTRELASNEARTTAIVNTAVDAIITIDQSGVIQRVNPSTERIFGWEEDALIGKNVSVLMADQDKQHHNEYLRNYLDTGAMHILGAGREAVARRKDGVMFPIDLSVSEAKVGDHRFFVGIIRDITERKAVEAELQAAKAAAEEAATHDPLTGLWNHNRILEVLMEEMARSDRLGTTVSLIMVDLDHFKMVNDGHGHMVGDEVLREIAVRLERAVRAYDSVGRFGGEEFMIVLPGTAPAEAELAAERIRAEIGKIPIDTAAGPLEVTASLGLVTRHGELVNDATALLVAADTALYESKESGRNRVTVAALTSMDGEESAASADGGGGATSPAQTSAP
jgi:diguanylate cyclase (GGDEF)-like protein/PAS domain S-box-containing protein